MILPLVLTALASAAPYGVPVDGYPSHEERTLVLWTNAARVAPEEFTDEYSAGGCSTDDFSDDEKTPKAPLYVDLDLTEAARFHSTDMKENGCFQHESCDGTDTWTRIGEFYTDAAGAMGENIAAGTTDPRFAVLSMWMCSHEGHRANIMSGDFNEMGGGVDAEYETQDFAGGELSEGDPPVRMVTDTAGTWFADWGDAAAPTTLSVVIDGIESPMTLLNGTAEQGIYSVSTPAMSDAPCHSSYVAWETSGGLTGSFPAEGSFLSGDCSADGGSATAANDAGDWSETHLPLNGLFGDVPEDDLQDAMSADVKLVGCTTVAPPSGLLSLGVAAGLLLVRRR